MYTPRLVAEAFRMASDDRVHVVCLDERARSTMSSRKMPPRADQPSTGHVNLLLEWLRGEGMGHDWCVRLVLKYGQSFGPSPLPPDLSAMQERCCYLNSYVLATEQPDRFTYFEGYASTARGCGWGTPRAWCIDRGGRVVDTTWGDPHERSAWRVPRNAYPAPDRETVRLLRVQRNVSWLARRAP